MTGPRGERVPVDKRRKPFTIRERRRMCQNFDSRPTNNWGSGDLPAPFCEGDIVRLVGEVPDEGDGWPRLRGQRGPLFVVSYACSVGEGDDWYFRVEDGTLDGYGSDRLHVFDGGKQMNWMEPFELVETRDPEGLRLREQMLAEGWRYEPPPTCAACGQRLPRSVVSGRQFQESGQ